MRIGIALGLGALLVTGAAWEAEDAFARPLTAVCSANSHPDRLEAVTSEGDLVLASEGHSRLAGIRLPDDPTYRQQALNHLRGQAVYSALAIPLGSRDRWGRKPVRIFIANKSAPMDLISDLVDKGLAIVDPGVDSVLCQPNLLAVEATARERRLGLWADGRYNPVPVDQAERLKERIGRFVIVEGRVRSIGERKQRTYLNFGGHWAEDFTIIIPRRTWTQMAERGISAASLKGKTLRARGILQSWQGTALTIDLPEMIERLEDGRLQGDKEDDERLAR